MWFRSMPRLSDGSNRRAARRIGLVVASAPLPGAAYVTPDGSAAPADGDYTTAAGTLTFTPILLLFGHLATWVIVPLVAIWPAGDPEPQATALFLAVQQGNVLAIDEILRCDVHVDSPDETGVTPLIAAARGGHIDAVCKLLAAGARIDACSPAFGTPLMAAAMYGHHDVMRELIERGANVDAVNPTGQTALWYARMNSDEEAVRILIAADARAEGHATRDQGLNTRSSDPRSSE